MLLKDRLKELRLERDLLQKDIAQILNLTTSAYGYYEQGKRVPDSETIKILSNFYNVSSDYLLGMSDVRNYTEDSNITIALNSDTHYDNLPKEAKDEINNFIEYIKQKYKDKR
ncbi:helix-turn-helix domain-containing protein [Clostridium beijerinckii]|uniref:helix-turn-helix domain-containing protein n=1 Tax=Clostridium beijerinckii TaxID=1520 RepID=UPI00080A6794|nr:helix-turn-helix transcriptional regulator [Clostridium beijerinckii]OCB00423.1 transcriptional regulator [Clostridium beijerinckii]